jgi:hypothetical protein
MDQLIKKYETILNEAYKNSENYKRYCKLETTIDKCSNELSELNNQYQIAKKENDYLKMADIKESIINQQKKIQFFNEELKSIKVTIDQKELRKIAEEFINEAKIIIDSQYKTMKELASQLHKLNSNALDNKYLILNFERIIHDQYHYPNALNLTVPKLDDDLFLIKFLSR